MGTPVNPELEEGFRALADGAWMNAATLLNQMGTKIQPGPAERWARANMSNPDAYGRSELVAMARHRISQLRAKTMLEAGRWEADVDNVGRGHWRGVEPFRIRDRFPGSITVQEAAAEIGVSENALKQWIDTGLAPQPARVSDKPGAVRHVLPATLAVYRKIAEVYPGPHKTAWDPHPHVFWRIPQGVVYCPHCGGGITVTNTLAKAGENQ